MIDGLHSLAKQRCTQFDARHGGDAVQIAPGWLLFADGATRETNTMGPLIEPPDNPFQRAKLIAAYHEHKLSLVVAEFDHHKKRLLSEGYIGSDAEIAQLKELQTKVLAAKKAWQDAVDEQNKSDPSYVPPEEAKRRAVQQSICDGFTDRWRKRVTSIEV